jgi:hypothetical protein
MMKRLLYILALIWSSSSVLTAQKLPVYEISKMSFNDQIFSEISPVIVENGIIFCSNRRFSTIKDRTSYDGSRLYNIYIAEKKDSNKWDKPRLLKSERTTKFNSGPLSLAPDKKTIYFTSEVETGRAATKKNYRNHSGIFIAELSGATDLQSVRPFKYNSYEYEVGNPSISNDGRYLYFASDKPGGLGKSDIYYSELINGEWSEPMNMGSKINTAGTENFPYIHPSGKLYFSSDRPGGSGRLDVYSTSMYNGAWDDPVLLSEPINSSSDDFAFVASDDLQTGYFSSNRTYSDDIFRFTSTIIRKTSCNELIENSYCFEFMEENAVKFDSMPFVYRWKFGDGTQADGPLVEHCYKGTGVYIVQLDVINLITKELISSEKSDTLVVEDAEQPYITSPDSVPAGKIIRLDAKSTNLPGWNIAQYYWNFGDETVASGEIVEKTYNRPGNYNIQLIVTTAPEPGGTAREACVSKNINIITVP